MEFAEEAESLSKSTKTSREECSPLSVQSWDEWAAVKDIRKCQVEKNGMPCDAFWNHMKNYTFDRAGAYFPWHVDWLKQKKEMKAAFLSRLRKIYPGGWLDGAVAQAIGNNIREKRNRLTTKFHIYNKKKSVKKPLGCTQESFDMIYQNYKEGKRKAKSDLCRQKQLERCSGGDVYSHRYGPGGIQSIVDRFVSTVENFSCLLVLVCLTVAVAHHMRQCSVIRFLLCLVFFFFFFFCNVQWKQCSFCCFSVNSVILFEDYVVC